MGEPHAERYHSHWNLAQNDADIQATVAHLQQTVNQNKTLARSTLTAINKWTRMRKFNKVITTCQQVLNKTSTPSPVSQPFISAPSTPPPLTRDTSCVSSPPDSINNSATSLRYTPYANSWQLTPPNVPPVKPSTPNQSIFKQLKKIVQLIINKQTKTVEKQLTSTEKEHASQWRLAQINFALQQNQNKAKPVTPTSQPNPLPSFSWLAEPAQPLPSQQQAFNTTNKGKNVVQKHTYPFNGKCYHCGQHRHQLQDCLNQKCW